MVGDALVGGKIGRVREMDVCMCVFFFQAEDGIRDAQESRGLGDVYKRQQYGRLALVYLRLALVSTHFPMVDASIRYKMRLKLSLIHI